MNKEKRFNTPAVIFILGLLTAIGPLSIDMYLPAFPQVAIDLETTLPKVIQSLSVFFIGISIGQLICGPLLERYGRKIPLYAGMLIYFITAIGCYFVRSVDTLIILRFFQAVGACVGMVASRALVRDLFPLEKTTFVFSMLLLVMSISPIVAPALGGYIATIWGWRAIFILLILITAAILLGVFFILPGGQKADPNISLMPGPIISNFAKVLKNRIFTVYTLTCSVSYAGLFGYIAVSPSVFMEHFGMHESSFGWVISIVAGGIVLASQVNNTLLKKYSAVHIIKVVVYAQAVIGILFFTVALLGTENLYVTVVFAFASLSCLGFIFPNATSLALAPMAENAGNASALMGTIQMALGAGISAATAVFIEQSVMLMAIVLSGCAVLTLAVLQIGSTKLNHFGQ